jgi:hypothetical protein
MGAPGMSAFKNAKVLARIRLGADCWTRNNFKTLMKYYREDAVLSSPFAPSPPGAENAWLQGHAEICEHFALLRQLHPNMRRVDVLFGTSFVVVLMSDGKRYLCLQIESDDEGMISRVIICRSASAKAVRLIGVDRRAKAARKKRLPKAAAPLAAHLVH